MGALPAHPLVAHARSVDRRRIVLSGAAAADRDAVPGDGGAMDGATEWSNGVLLSSGPSFGTFGMANVRNRPGVSGR